MLSKKLRLNKIKFHQYFKKFFSAAIFPFSINFNYAYIVFESKSNSIYLCAVYGKEKTTKIYELKDRKEIKDYNMSFTIELPIYVFTIEMKICTIVLAHLNTRN